MAISDKLEKIKKRSASLNAKTDSFNATVEYIERSLLGSGVEFFWLPDLNPRRHGGPRLLEAVFHQEEAQRNERHYTVLGYTKLGGEWHLVGQMTREVQADDGDWEIFDTDLPVPLTRCSRTVRLEAAGFLEEFLDALLARMEELEKRVDTANALVNTKK